MSRRSLDDLASSSWVATADTGCVPNGGRHRREASSSPSATNASKSGSQACSAIDQASETKRFSCDSGISSRRRRISSGTTFHAAAQRCRSWRTAHGTSSNSRFAPVVTGALRTRLSNWPNPGVSPQIRHHQRLDFDSSSRSSAIDGCAGQMEVALQLGAAPSLPKTERMAIFLKLPAHSHHGVVRRSALTPSPYHRTEMNPPGGGIAGSQFVQNLANGAQVWHSRVLETSDDAARGAGPPHAMPVRLRRWLHTIPRPEPAPRKQPKGPDFREFRPFSPLNLRAALSRPLKFREPPARGAQPPTHCPTRPAEGRLRRSIDPRSRESPRDRSARGECPRERCGAAGEGG